MKSEGPPLIVSEEAVPVDEASPRHSSADRTSERLAQLMSWKQSGLLNDMEFAAAKRAMGL